MAGRRIVPVAVELSSNSTDLQSDLQAACSRFTQDEHVGAPRQLGETTPWTRLELEMDVPKDAYQVWAWLLYNAPADGRVYFDDASLEVVGPAKGAATPAAPTRVPAKKAAAVKPKPGAAGKP